MTGENGLRHRDEGAFSTHAQTIAEACRYQAGTASRRWCQKTVIKRYRSQLKRSSRTVLRQVCQHAFDWVMVRSALGAGAGAEEVLDLGEEARGVGLGCAGR